MPILDVTPLSYEGHWRAWPKGKKKHTFKRGEAAIEDQFKIAQLSLSQDNSRKRLGFSFELGLSGDNFFFFFTTLKWRGKSQSNTEDR